jgi:uncharacterized protein (DUF1800 family)
VARLFARAGFGATRSEIETWTASGYAAAVDYLLSFPPASGRADDAQVAALEQVGYLADQPGYSSYPVDISVLQGWWLRRMATTKYPLEEKLTLHWHSHFATAYAKVLSYGRMVHQNRTLRGLAGGDFRALCKAVTTDPAMLVFLDGWLSFADGLNENYAREFFELFSLGHDNGYTQADIRESARALTGWSIDSYTGVATYYPTLHDGGVKTILGNTGAWTPLDVVDITLDRHPQGRAAAATYVARRLARFLYQPQPEDDVVGAMATAFATSNFQVKPMLRALFLHPLFMDGPALTHRSPAEIVAATVRGLKIHLATDAIDTVPATAQQQLTYGQTFDFAGRAARDMGQSLFDPVNVAGWKGGTAWSNTATVIGRYNWAVTAAGMVSADTVTQVLAAAHGDPAQTADGWMAKLGLLELRPDTRAGIDEWTAAAHAAGDNAAVIARGVLTLLIASPDFALR